MTNHDEGDEGNNDGNEDGNNNENAASRSGYYGPIFYPMETSQSCFGIAEEYRSKTKMTMALRPRRHIYLRVGIYLPYKYYSKYVP